MVTSLRILILGGLTSYRALFTWLSPWILIPTFVVEPVFQVIFFAFVGREARINDDRFFLIGHAVQFAAPLSLGRALPVIVNGFGSTVVALVVGGAALRVALSAVAGLAGREAAVGVLYAAIGMGLLRLFEAESRRRAMPHVA